MSEDITCPFCNKKGFDLIGLKYHLMMGYCEEVICPFCKKRFDVIDLKYHLVMGNCKQFEDTMTVEEEAKLFHLKKDIDEESE